MSRFGFRAAIAALIGLGAATSGQATILLGSVTGGSVQSTNPAGTFVKLDPTAGGFSVGFNNFDTHNLYGFDELQNVVLTSALAADLGLASIAIGTRINSHFVFFDPLATQTVRGSITFDTPLLGVITTRSKLIASNYLGAPGVTYLTPASVGLEPGVDFAISSFPSPNDLRIVTFNADSPGDAVRVITAASAVPEPASWAMLIAGFGIAGAALRRQRRRGALALA